MLWNTHVIFHGLYSTSSVKSEVKQQMFSGEYVTLRYNWNRFIPPGIQYPSKNRIVEETQGLVCYPHN